MYNKDMDEQKNTPNIINESNVVDKTEMIKEKDKAGLKKVNGKWVVMGISLSGVILIAVIVAVVMNLMNNEKKVDKSGTGGYSIIEDNEDSSNTDLKSGSVTTTIDGRTVTYKGAYVVDGIEAEITSGTYESTNDDEAVFLVINGGALKINGDVAIDKTGSEDFAGRGDEYSFYGKNSAIVVVGEGSSVSVEGVTIDTSVSGANAVVATNGGMIRIAESTIKTTRDNSRGLYATFGGTINADNVNISTQGGSSAALATDRGEGTVVADNMTLATAGAGSPLIYSTGDIVVTNSNGTATGAQIAVVEGKNSVELQGCDFSANGNGNRGDVDNAGVMIYQSMSGDAGEGMGSFTATDCELVVLASSAVYDNTPFFFVTNTSATIDLTGTSVEFSDNEYFISALGTNEWGRSGNNGGKVNVSMSDIDATNTNVQVDEISDVSGI